MKSRQLYIIELKSANEDSDYDPMLYLETPGGMIVSQDDDSGGDLNARIFFQCRRDGEYRIIATSSDTEVGEFTLTDRTQAGD